MSENCQLRPFERPVEMDAPWTRFDKPPVQLEPASPAAAETEVEFTVNPLVDAYTGMDQNRGRETP